MKLIVSSNLGYCANHCLVSSGSAELAASTTSLVPNVSDEQVETRAFELMAHLMQQQGQTRTQIEQMRTRNSSTTSSTISPCGFSHVVAVAFNFFNAISILC